MLRSSQAAWAARLEGGSREGVTAAVDGLAVPTLLAAGSDDGVIPPAVHAAETLSRLPNGRLVTVNGTGHPVPLEAPEAVADLVRGASR